MDRQSLLGYRRYLESQFSTDHWSNLSFDQRLDLCRELENTYAAEAGVPPCQVSAVYMDGGTYGYQVSNRIVINSHILEDGTFHVMLRDEQDNVILDDHGSPIEKTVAVPAPNWACMETVYHEGTHGIQAAEGRSNTTYINSETDYDLYRIQGNEREAFAVSQLRTLEAIEYYEKESGVKDANSSAYLDSVRQNSYDAFLESAAYRYNDPNIQDTLDSFISNQDSGIIASDPSESYQAISEIYSDQELRLGHDNDYQNPYLPSSPGNEQRGPSLDDTLTAQHSGQNALNGAENGMGGLE